MRRCSFTPVGFFTARLAIGGLAAAIAFVATACNEHVGLGVIPDGSGSGGVLDGGGSGGAGSGGAGTGAGGAAGGGPGGAGGGTQSVLWRATFEPMNLSEWTSDAAGGYLGNAPSVVADVIHRGKFAAKMTVAPKAPLIAAQYLFREAPSPTEAYYSAWFYFPSTFTIPVGMHYLSVFHFNVSSTGDGKNTSALWDLNFITDQGASVPQVYNFPLVQNTQQNNGLARWTAPRDTWFHIEMLFAKATTATGRIAVWMDDVLIIDLNKVVTAPNDWLQWNAGAASDMAPASIYMDDAAISTVRIGSQPLP